MNSDSPLHRYIEARKIFYERLGATKSRLDSLLEEMLDHPPTLRGLAQLEGVHAEKHALFTEFISTEERFVEELLRQRQSMVDGST